MIYEFRCRSCGRPFEVTATLEEKEAGLSPACPRCGSGDVRRVFSRVTFLRPAGGEAGGGEPGGGDFNDGFGDDGDFGDDDGDGGFGGDEGSGAGWDDDV